jgi:hypothetical protein
MRTHQHPKHHPLYAGIVAVAEATMNSEAQIDKALADTATLLAIAIEEHRKTGLPATEAQPAIERIGGAMHSLIDSRRHVITAHASFGLTAAKLGATPEAFGDWWPCPQPPKNGIEEGAGLHAVATAA